MAPSSLPFTASSAPPSTRLLHRQPLHAMVGTPVLMQHHRCRSVLGACQRLPPSRMQRGTMVRVMAAKTDAKPVFQPGSAKEAIERGTQVFRDTKDYNEAIRLYKAAMALRPSDDEARAALYNLGCAYSKQKQWGPAAEAVVKAINDYGLKLAVALKDDDLAELRDRREWFDALTEVKGGVSRRTKLDLRSEAKAPFRLPRIVLFGGLAIGAAAGLFIITLRLIKALQGGEGAPELQETAQNFGINLAAVAVLSFLVWRDVGEKKKSLTVTEREEMLSRLQLDLGGDRQLPLVRFRGLLRPVIIAGSKSFVERAIREARLCEEELRMRGVSVVPIYTDMPDDLVAGQSAKPEDPEARIRALKKELQSKESNAKGFGAAAPAVAPKPASEAEAVASVAASASDSPVLESDKKWRLTPYNTAEWKAWINQQREYANLGGPLGGDLYIQVQLDGTVRSSGLGMPPWRKFIDDLPSLLSIRTTFTDGIGPNI